MRARPAATWLVALVAAAGCRAGRSETTARADSAEATRRGALLAQSLAGPDSAAAPRAAMAQWLLSGDLAEISGLALTADGRLLTHGDEKGRVFELDYRRGVLVKRFSVGTPPVRGDFEGITVVGDAVYLLASNGKLYEFQEGASEDHVEYSVHDTKLGHECEFEGVAFDSTSNALLLACKNVRTAGPLRDSLVIYRWKLPLTGHPATRLTVPLARVIGSNPWKGLHPSDITVDPFSGNYVLVAAEERALIEITPAGDVVFARPLPDNLNHVEGVAITRDSILIISNEARRSSAAITLYRWP